MVGGIAVFIQEYRNIGKKLVGRNRERRCRFEDEGDDRGGENFYVSLCDFNKKNSSCERNPKCKFLLFFFFWLVFMLFFIIIKRPDFFLLFNQLYSEIDAMGIGKGVSTPNWLVKTKTTLEIPVKRLETLRAEVEPKWWSEWLALNQPESENTVNKGGVEKEKK